MAVAEGGGADVNETLWYVARGGGLVSLALLAVSVALGLVLGARLPLPGLPRPSVIEVHRFASMLAMVFAAVHVLALLLDADSGVSPLGAVVPFVDDVAPLGTAMGILALQMAVAVWVSTRLRRRIGHAWWRAIHRLTYAVFALGLLHGVLAGTDTGGPVATAVHLGALALVGPPLVVRMLGPAPAAPRRPPPRHGTPDTPGTASLPPLPPARPRRGGGLPPLRPS